MSSLLRSSRPGSSLPGSSGPGRGRRAIASSCVALLLGSPALTSAALAQPAPAQTVRVFDDAPSIEQLRSIMIPESRSGTGRTIVMQRPDTGAPSTTAQRVATQVLPAPRTPVAAAGVSSAPAEMVATSVATSVAGPSMPAKPAPAPAAEAMAGAEARPGAEARSGGKAKPSVDARTSSDAQAATEAKPGTVGLRINFGFDSAVLPEQAHVMIDRVAEVMKEAPGIKVRVEGHTDAIGSADYNVSLSERRAVSVAEYLVKCGIDPSRLVLVGKGMAEPLTRNPYDPNNRRVQFVRIG